MQIGYMRVSKADGSQVLDLQKDALLAAGVVYGAAIFVVMWFAIVPLVDPVMLKLNGLAFAIAHVMWGAVLGAALAWQDHRAAELQRAHA